MLEARNLSKRYDNSVALNQLNLRVDAGEIFCLLGSNGAGKSTTINLFLNFVEPTEGAALIDGTDVSKDPIGSKRRLAYIPEQVALYGHLTGLENLAYLAALGANGRSFAKADLRALLKEAGLQESAHRRQVRMYSKGMRQKVGIALAIARQATNVLLDEPTSGLDPQASNEFSNLLLSMKERGVSILMATHDLFRAKETGTRLGIMRHGTLREVINASEIGHRDLEALYLKHMRD